VIDPPPGLLDDGSAGTETDDDSVN
jgi:hypothetical protein